MAAFSVNLDEVVLNRRLVEASIGCVQKFVRWPQFTLLDFFSDNEIGCLVSTVNVAGTIREQLTKDPWENVLPEE